MRVVLAIAATAALIGCASQSLEAERGAPTAPGDPSLGGAPTTPDNPKTEGPTTEFILFGGAVATCAALSCAQAERIYRRAAAGPWSAPSRSGFAFVEEREGVWLAHREGGGETSLGPTSFRSLGGWGTRTAFRIDVHVDTVTVDGITEEGMYFDVVSSGASAGTNPVVPTHGGATWSGAMAAVVTALGTERHGSLVTGDASVTLTEPPGAASISVDVAFTNVVSERTGAPLQEMRWTGLSPRRRRLRGARDRADRRARRPRPHRQRDPKRDLRGVPRRQPRGSGRGVQTGRAERRIRSEPQALIQVSPRSRADSFSSSDTVHCWIRSRKRGGPPAPGPIPALAVRRVPPVIPPTVRAPDSRRIPRNSHHPEAVPA